MSTTETHPHVLSNLASSIGRSVSISYTGRDSANPQEERVDLTCVDSRQLAILNDNALHPHLIVKFSPDDPTRAPALRDYSMPTVLREVYTAEDRLVEVSFAIMHWTTVKTNHEIARDKDNKPYQCLTLKKAAIDYRLDNGNRLIVVGTDCNADIFLPSGMIRLL